MTGNWKAGALALALAGACLFAATSARADDTTYNETSNGSGQNVVFKDDPLAAGGFGPNDALLHVPGTPKRVMLLRPRTQFIPELLKSVENL